MEVEFLKNCYEGFNRYCVGIPNKTKCYNFRVYYNLFLMRWGNPNNKDEELMLSTSNVDKFGDF